MKESVFENESLILVILSEKSHKAVSKTFLRIMRRKYRFGNRMQCMYSN